MNKHEFKKAFKLADSEIDLSGHEFDIFWGFGLSDFKPVHCTIESVARLMRWQAQYMFGGWDSEELDNICRIGRRKFVIIND